MPAGNILKFIVSKETHAALKQQGLKEETHPFEIPGSGFFMQASTLQDYYTQHDLTDETLSNYNPAQKLFVSYEET